MSSHLSQTPDTFQYAGGTHDLARHWISSQFLVPPPTPASWLFLDHRHSPALLHLHWCLLCLERTSPRHPSGHSLMSFTSLLRYHLLNEAYTDHSSKTATFPVPTQLYSRSPSSKNLPILRQTLSSLIRLTLPPLTRTQDMRPTESVCF